MINEPKISIIVPIYGVEAYLRQCIDSIINQTLKDIEIILIDDGGKDNCPQIIDEYAKKDSRIVAIHKPNGGYGQSCNCGLDVARGEFIGIVEPDDFIDKNMYEDLYAVATNKNADIVKSAYWESYEKDDENNLCACEKYCYFGRAIIPPKEVFNIREYSDLLVAHPSIWSAIYRRGFLIKNDIRFVEAKGAGWVDNPFHVKTLCLADRIAWIPNAYYHYRLRREGNSSDLKDYTIPISRINEIHDFFDEHKDIYNSVFFNFTKKEISYLYIAFKTGFNNLKTVDEIHNMKKLLKDTIKRIPKDMLKKCKFRKDTRWKLRKIKSLGYSLIFYYKRLVRDIKEWKVHE